MVLFFPVTLFQHSAAHFHSCVHAFRTGVMRAFHSPGRWRPSVEGNEPSRRVSKRGEWGPANLKSAYLTLPTGRVVRTLIISHSYTGRQRSWSW